MARSYSVAWPTDSWIVSQRLVGSMTRSYGPATTLGRLDLLGEQLGDGGELGVEVPAVAGEVLPAPARGRGEGVHGLEAACGAVDGGRGDGGRDAHALLDRRGAREVGVELALADLGDGGLDVVDAVGGQQALRPLGEQGDLVAGRHVEGVESVGGDPDGVGVDGLVGPLHPLPRDRGEGAGHLDGLLGDGGRPLGGEVAVGGEAPDAVDQHADGQPDHRLVRDAGDRPVAQRDRLGEDAFDADVGVLGAAFSGPVERGVGEGGERQRAELRVDPVEHGFNLERDPDARPPAPIKVTPPTESPISRRRVATFLAASRAFHRGGRRIELPR